MHYKASKQAKKLPYGYGNSESWDHYPEVDDYTALLKMRELYPELYTDSVYAELLEKLLPQPAPRPQPAQPVPRPSAPQCTSAQSVLTAQPVPISSEDSEYAESKKLLEDLLSGNVPPGFHSTVWSLRTTPEDTAPEDIASSKQSKKQAKKWQAKMKKQLSNAPSSSGTTNGSYSPSAP